MLTVLLRATIDPFAGFVIETVGAMLSETGGTFETLLDLHLITGVRRQIPFVS